MSNQNVCLFRIVAKKGSGSSENDQEVKNDHGFHEGCHCEKCSQRFYKFFICLYLILAFNRKEEKRMLYEYNAKLQALIQEKFHIIRQLKRENKAIKEFKEVIIRLVYCKSKYLSRFLETYYVL